jgi:hypothetical protein
MRDERPRRHGAAEERDEAASSINHLGGAGEQRWRHAEAKRPAVCR